jgi:hypothetical protein
MNTIINTREDLDALKGTQKYDDFLLTLIGSMTRRQNAAEYPEGYGQPGYEGPTIEPVWMDVEDLSMVTRFGFRKDELFSQVKLQDADGNVMNEEEKEAFLKPKNLPKDTVTVSKAEAYENKVKAVQAQRACAYPPVADYLDAIVKGDQKQLDTYIAKCQAVKLKYPKP